MRSGERQDILGRMWRLTSVVLSFCLFFGAAAIAQPEPRTLRRARLGHAARPQLPHDPAHLLVRLASGVDAAKALPAGSRPIFERWFKVPAGPGLTASQALESWLSRPGVETVELNYVARVRPLPSGPRAAPEAATFTPNDPLYPLQWHLEAIQMPAAWALSRGEGVRVAVIDTGVARGGKDLKCQAFPAEYDAFLDLEGPGVAARDVLGHGTHVAGTVAQCTQNAEGFAGVAFASTLLPVVAADPEDPQDLPFDALARGVVWASEHGAKVVNISVGTDCDGLGWPECSSSVLNEALELAAARDVLVVVSVGNSKQDSVAHPANHPDVVAVTALDLDGLAPYPNRGEAVDLAAPGGNVRQDLDDDGHRDVVFQETLGSFCVSPKEYVYCGSEGTSMASPHVAGAAALLRSYRPAATALQVRQALEESAQDLGAPGRDPLFGSGALRAHAALLRLDELLLEEAPEPCQPGPTTLCIDDQPGDARFRIEVTFATSQAGGLSGKARAIPLAGLGVSAGGLFWFFGQENPELLVKILDGCGVNGDYWVFYSAGTNVGFTVTVDDTATGRRRTYDNRDLTPAPPVQDTAAFSCS